MNNKLKVLVITYLPWRNDMNVGNTITNLFKGMENKIEFCNIFIKDGIPDNGLCSKYFCISEKKLAKSIINRHAVGNIYINESKQEYNNTKLYNKARQLRWDLFLLIQDFIGLLGCWKSKNLDDFIKKNNPDLIFAPIGRVPLTNKLVCHICEKYNIPFFGYMWDDHYSLKKFSLSPFFWIRTFIERKYIKHSINNAKIVYSISKEMMSEYSTIFKKEFKLLYKGYDFRNNIIHKDDINNPVRIIYMGNIGNNRWKGLYKIAKAIEKINADRIKVILQIYTMSPKSKKIEKMLNIKHMVEIVPPVKSSEIENVMKSADILLHIEPNKLKDRLFYRLSFSTKLVDYFYASRCILAFGPDNSSLKYLKRNNAGIVENNYKKAYKTIFDLIENKDKIVEYSKNAWNCGVNNHQIDEIQNSIYNDFYNNINR